MNKCGQLMSESDLRSTFDSIDTDGNNHIDYNEFLLLITEKLRTTNVDEEIKQAFLSFDRNNDGYITSSELKRAMKNYGEELTAAEIQEIISEADIDNDGKINYLEFEQIMKNL